LIDFQTIERIQSASQIVEVVSDFISLRKRGVNFVGLCPFHEDKTPSFYVSPAKNICKCFACGEGGTPIHFIMKHEQLSYVEALKYLAKKYGIEVQEKELSNEQKQEQSDRESMFILNSFAQKTFSSNLLNNSEGRSVGLSYFQERGFREDTVRKFELGYSLEKKNAFTEEAQKAGYQKKYLEKTGLSLPVENDALIDRFRGRVMFPIHSLAGKIVGFGGRILKNEKTAKYLNSPDSEVYNKSRELYGIYFGRNAINKQDKCYLVEGYTDVISMHQAGIENVVAPCGTALTHEQIRLIYRLTKNISLLYDGDSAGIKAANKGINLFLEAGMNVKIVLLPPGEDPDSFARKQNASSFNQYIEANETDFIQFKASLLTREVKDDPTKKAGMITEIVEVIALIPEEIIRSLYIKECARITGIGEPAILRAVTKKRQENAVQKKRTLYPEVQNPNGSPAPEKEIVNETGSGSVQLGMTDDLESNPLEKHEREIVGYVIRYGEIDMVNVRPQSEKGGKKVQESEPVYVIQYIVEELENDELEFVNPIYRQILQETHEKFRKEGFCAEEHFRMHPDYKISELAVDLCADPYIESKVHSKHKEIPSEKEKLIDKIPYLVINYKNAILQNRIDETSVLIKESEKAGDYERALKLTKEQIELWESQKALAKHLRERIITKV
jgi:DNA primase, catalytic core